MAFTHHGDLPYLPQELFQMIVRDLEPVDIVRCRRVSSAWYRAFTNPISLIQILKSSYPRAKEVRELCQPDTPNALQTVHGLSQDKWRALFDTVVERYHRLTSCGKPRSVQKFDLQETNTAENGCCYVAVEHWETHTSHPGTKIDMLFGHTFWTYEEGLVVFPDKHERSLVVLDLETRLTYMVPFVIANKNIRRIRLQDRLLVVEWADEDQPDMWSGCGWYYHYATSFEINRVGRAWDVTLRNEWEMIPNGLSLGYSDRFFSTHNRRHYAIYTSLDSHTAHRLTIWDISKPSEYRPSQDCMNQLEDTATDAEPFIVFEYDYDALDLMGLRMSRQGEWHIEIMRMDIDSSTSTVSITQVMDGGRMDYNPLEYTPRTKVTCLPFRPGCSPLQEVQTVYPQTVYPPYRGNCSMEIPPWTATSPWPCYWGICESTDEKANVSFCLSYLSSRTQTGYEEDPLMVTIQTSQSIKTLNHEFAEEVSFKGKICGDERFLVGENAQNQLVVLYF
ncbi:hypothetical protein UA08_05265 [Talaromyces atroroseus]|uniref:F-box domain-containing protein n=1 Tax=Talaromyces atroroseus TaxID=1441469 RepID=A0A225AYD0_TALAT|nr:hypothetical protein UA08_05265 [Talaromyces atroroseus]OKL59475.1 hypothetical protein UA08_05265 [Talaromyces atroroseus]